MQQSHGAVDLFLDRVYKNRVNKEDRSDRFLTFTELLHLLGPINNFVSQAMGTSNKTSIRSTLSMLFNKLANQKRQTYYPQEQIDETI